MRRAALLTRLPGRCSSASRRRSIFEPLGGSGTPANLLGLAFLLWWVLAKVGSGLGVDRGRQPVRIALLAFVAAGPGQPGRRSTSRPFTGLESSGVYRGLVYLAALCGVALVAADGIPSSSGPTC